MDEKRDMEIVRLRQQGATCVQIAEKFGISDARVSQIYRQWLMEQVRTQYDDGNRDQGLFHRMVELSDMKKADGNPSHIPSTAYISIRRYWESLHPGKLITIDDVCRMTEHEVSNIPNTGEGLQGYIRKFKQDIIRERVRRELQEVTPETLLAAEKDRSTESLLRIAVYLRVSAGSLSNPAIKEHLQAGYLHRVERLFHTSACAFYIDEGSNDSGFTKLQSDCKAGKVSLIYTRSILRFGQSVDDAIRAIGQLKHLSPPVGIFFSENGLYTLSPKSEELWQQFLDLIEEE